jgi:TetR/AcrR family transcriptional regulator, regulator of autoinduction and epiphytic fitness
MARRGTEVRDDVQGGAAGSGADTSTAILDAARRLFLEAGYEGVNLDQVGRAAGVSRQTVYNQFGSKDAVFRAVVDRHWDAIRTEVAAVSAPSLGLDADAENVLRRFAQSLLRFVHETDQIAFTRLVIAESRHLPWIAEAFYQAGKAPLVEAFAAVLAKLTERRLLTCDRPELAARQFMGLIQEFVIWPQVMAIGVESMGALSEEVVVDEAVAVFLARYGLKRQASAL